ncbi:hypothetical protein AZSI13_16520 [Azospira sp. I13]|uniref:hypothetical protein n=1 Tax=Azospira sp. I13 TaxID=1765050 RepID=UPI000D4893DA|nr:hypothetical protein [Azospira sp. I13]GBG02325.1 hypothetical protein AZSI13_16520 [Azospira sp. I13]
MEIAFEDLSLRVICENPSKAQEKLGDRVTAKLIARLADLRSVDSVVDLPAGKPNSVNGSYGEGMSISLGDNFYIVIVPNHKNCPLLASGKINWRQVTRIKLIQIDKHE